MADQPISVFNLWDESNPRSLINLVGQKTGDYIRQAYAKAPELFGIDERDLRKRLRLMECHITPTDNRLRLAFWQEYDYAQANLKPFRITAVCHGIMNHGYFTDKYLSSATRVAWLLCPPASYESLTTEALQYGMEILRDILEEPNTHPNGQLNMKLLEIKLKIVAMIDLRLKGLPTQKIEQRTIGFSIHDSMRGAASASMDNTMVDLEKRMKELEIRERRALNMPEPPTPAPEPKTDIDAEFTNV